MRIAGPWLPEHKVGRANLAAAFPDKSAAEIEQILGGVWDNLGRFAAEFAHIDRMTMENPGRAQPRRLRRCDDDVALPRSWDCEASAQPGLFFAAHSRTGSCLRWRRAYLGLRASILFRRPNIGGAATRS